MTFRPLAVGVAALLAGCAPAAPPADVSARAVPTAPLAVGYDLPPVAAPDLPPALRTAAAPAAPMDHSAMDHSAMDHSAMDHASMGHTVPVAPAAMDRAEPNHDAMHHATMDHDEPDHAAMDHDAMGHAPPGAPAATAGSGAMHHAAPLAQGSQPTALAPAVGAYLALQAALAGDDLAASDDAAGALAAALVQAGVGPELQAHAVAADAATDLVALRAAFGRLSPPFIALVERVGAPAGMELSAFRCGMADAPEGGVWLQATGDLANPYFGAAMRTCGRQTGAVGHDAASHEEMHGATGGQHD